MTDKKNAYDYASSPTIATELEKTQINKFHGKGATGFAAEEANAQVDRWAGKKVEQVGTSNAANGADRIVDGVPIQTKYFKEAATTFRAAFDEQGVYRYSGQMLEVPSDQYEECLRRMREKILGGQVPGVTDPAMAELLVKKGSYTYRQARNIARAGNVDSLLFDAKTQAVTTGYAFALSFVINFARAKWDGQDNRLAIKESLVSALQSGGLSFVAGIATAQLLRTRAAALGAVFMRDGVKVVARTGLGKAAVQKLAEVSLGKAVYGAAAVNHVAKLLRTNALTGAITTVVITGPDFYRAAFQGSISWAQLSKNFVVNGAGVAAGIGGWMGGAVGGAAIGTAVFPGVGTSVGGVIGGLVGSIAAGTAGSVATKAVADLIVEDDAQQMVAELQGHLQVLADEYVLSPAETALFIERLKGRIDTAFLRDMFKSEDRAAFVAASFEPLCEEITSARPPVTVPDPAQVQAELDAMEQSAGAALDEEVRQYLPAVIEHVVPPVVSRDWLHREDADLDFLQRLASDELDALVRILTHDTDGKTRLTESLTGHALYKAHHPDHRQYWDLVAAEVQSFGANSISTLLRGGKGVPYREVLRDVCDRLSVDHDKDGVTEAIERALLAKLVEDYLQKTPDEELQSMAQALGLQASQGLRGPALSAAMLTAFQAGGFLSQRIVVMMMTSILKLLLGRGIQFAGSGVVMPMVGTWAGPIGWALTGAWAVFDLSNPAYRVTVPAVLQIAAMRRQYLMELRGEIPA